MGNATVEHAPQTSYAASLFAPLFRSEDRHFWFRTRNRVIAAMVRQIISALPAGYHVLEVGCGTGNVLRVLEGVCECGTVIGMDLYVEGLRFARERTRCPLVRADMHRPPFREIFDVIGLFDVLEHLPDDLPVLRDLHAMLAPGGALLLTVPAHPFLWSYFDEASHHCRRYERADLERKLRESGYRVAYLTEYMAPLFPLIWLGRRAAGLRARAPETRARDADDLLVRELRAIPVVNGLLRAILAPEQWFLKKRKRLPIGTSLLAIAYKMVDHDA